MSIDTVANYPQVFGWFYRDINLLIPFGSSPVPFQDHLFNIGCTLNSPDGDVTVSQWGVYFIEAGITYNVAGVGEATHIALTIDGDIYTWSNIETDTEHPSVDYGRRNFSTLVYIPESAAPATFGILAYTTDPMGITIRTLTDHSINTFMRITKLR